MLKRLKGRISAPSESHTAGVEPARVIYVDSEGVADGSDSVSEVSAVDCVLVTKGSKRSEVGGRSVNNNEQSQNAAAVAKIFESTKLFEDRFGKLLPAFEQVGRLGSEAATAFESIKTLSNHLERLAGAFESVKGLQDQLALLASSFDPVSSLQGRFAEVSNAFRDHLKQLISALQPARAFHARLVELAATFESAGELQQRLERLAAAFDPVPRPTPASTEGEAAAVSASGPLA
jgi:DNA repair ATPase RecN